MFFCMDISFPNKLQGLVLGIFLVGTFVGTLCLDFVSVGTLVGTLCLNFFRVRFCRDSRGKKTGAFVGTCPCTLAGRFVGLLPPPP